MTLAQAKQRTNAYVDARIGAFVIFQNIRLGNKGRHWQGMMTHTTPPDGETNGFPDRTGTKPLGLPNFETWEQTRAFLDWTGNTPDNCPAQFRVDEHGDQGWTLIAVLKRPAKSHRRVWGRGGGESSPWEPLEELPT